MIIKADCLDYMRTIRTNSFDLVFTSPPYEAARTYGIDFKLKGQDWVDWALERFVECVRISRGLVAWVVEGQTRKFRYSASPVLLMADLHRAGIHLRKPPIFHRVGIPGSGGPDWLRNDYEFVICATSGGKLPRSDNVAMGHPPKWAPGGEMSHRLSDGTKRNQWGHSTNSKSRKVNGERDEQSRPSHVVEEVGKKKIKIKRKRSQLAADRGGSGVAESEDYEWEYKPPAKANPGNVIKRNVGGGQMGDPLAHENEAPFPESLAEFFVRSFCPPGGKVFDPFSGSGTTLAVAKKNGRRGFGVDIRESQVELTKKRLGLIGSEAV